MNRRRPPTVLGIRDLGTVRRKVPGHSIWMLCFYPKDLRLDRPRYWNEGVERHLIRAGFTQHTRRGRQGRTSKSRLARHGREHHAIGSLSRVEETLRFQYQLGQATADWPSHQPSGV